MVVQGLQGCTEEAEESMAGICEDKSAECLSDYKLIRNYVVQSIRKDKAEYQKQLMRRM